MFSKLAKWLKLAKKHVFQFLQKKLYFVIINEADTKILTEIPFFLVTNNTLFIFNEFYSNTKTVFS